MSCGDSGFTAPPRCCAHAAPAAIAIAVATTPRTCLHLSVSRMRSTMATSPFLDRYAARYANFVVLSPHRGPAERGGRRPNALIGDLDLAIWISTAARLPEDRADRHEMHGLALTKLGGMGQNRRDPAAPGPIRSATIGP